jgi:putative ABC transport system ATP-binding protein
MLTLTNIQKTYSGSTTATLKGINLTVNKGEFVIIIGGNGSGKSTLLKIISGEYAIDSGKMERSALVATVTQDTNKGTIGELTVLENIVISLAHAKAAKFNFYKRKRAIVLLLLQTLGLDLEHYIDAPLKSLSGGQRQMIAMLMAICTQPQLLLLDEHTSALDPKTQKILMEYTATYIQKNSVTTMMITHKLEDAINYGNRLIMLNEGRIILDVKGEEKSALDPDSLLALFHQYHDVSLVS